MGKPASALPTHDFNVLLHELRTREIRRMPPGATRFLSAGCAGGWYFDWIASNYPGMLQVHYGVEAYSPCPADLPVGVRWVKNTIGKMQDVADRSIDLVFAGQTVEHVWPPDLADFLLESHRVLAPGGHLVCDSPNRVLTWALGWVQPQHTAELTVPEIVELLQLAGFDDISVRGIWLCYDRAAHRVLDMMPIRDRVWTPERRATEATNHPEDSFIWWAEARKGAGKPDRQRLHERASAIYDHVTAATFSRASHTVGQCLGRGPDRIVEAGVGQSGLLLCGPDVPLSPGAYRARFEVRRGEANAPANEPIVLLDVHDGCEDRVIALRVVTAGQLPADRWSIIDVPFDLSNAVFGVRVRVNSLGVVPLASRLVVDLRERGAVSASAEPLVGPQSRIDDELVRRLLQKMNEASSKPLRYRLADRVNNAVKMVGPVHRLMKRLVR
jgi:SAM-dependent methyltransferase